MKPSSTRTAGIAARHRTRYEFCHSPLSVFMGPPLRFSLIICAKRMLCSRCEFCIRLMNMNDSGLLGSKPWYLVVKPWYLVV